LEARDGWIRKEYINLYLHFPAWLRHRLDYPVTSAERRFISCRYLAALDPAARAAIPELIRVVEMDEDIQVRMNAIDALRSIATKRDDAVIICLTAASKDADSNVRAAAVVALQSLDPKIGPDVEGP
jgi:HEAT repeat protein